MKSKIFNWSYVHLRIDMAEICDIEITIMNVPRNVQRRSTCSCSEYYSKLVIRKEADGCIIIGVLAVQCVHTSWLAVYGYILLE